MSALNINDLNNGKLDLNYIAEVATSTMATATDRLGNEKDTVKGAIDSLKAFNSRGAWVVATVYYVKDLVQVDDDWYVCVGQHISGASFLPDSIKWRVHQGVTSNEFDLERARVAASLPRSRVSRPAFIEQHFSGFFGRGMLTAETINVTTEQALSGSFTVGESTLTVTDAAHFLVGGCVTVEHDNGRYGTYFVDSKAVNNIGIRPALRYPCAAGRIERTWFNRAHPGKFYMRELAQRIAHSSELDAAMPGRGRVLFTNVASNPNTVEDTLVPIGGATVNYYDEVNLGEDGTTATPVRFSLGRGAYVANILANSDGVETQRFDINSFGDAMVKVVMYASSTTSLFSIRLFDENDEERGKYILPGAGSNRINQVYSFPVDLRGARQIRVRIACEFFSVSGGYLAVNQIDVFEAPSAAGPIISNPAARIVCLGDSWVAGDLGSTVQREPITTQLALELPYATIINAGVGGNKITDMIARFDADVASHDPEYVVINTGTNEAYSPLSGTFLPNAVDDFIVVYRRLLNMIAAIGARPIIIGVPALAQSDADVPGFTEWLLNDRAKAYVRYFFEGQGRRPLIMAGSNANGAWVKSLDGTLICRHNVTVTTIALNTLASTLWTFPMAFSSFPSVTASPSNYSTNQVIGSGVNGIAVDHASVCLVSGANAVAMPIDCIAVGRWYEPA
jgi:hypothetical protein